MDAEAGVRRARIIRMEDQDRVSQASSVATISYFPVNKQSDGKLQTFGKRCQSAKRDPNCPVIIRGWLNKKDSAGLKLWKRRWFVLSNYCLFYYKDSREESVMGSIPLPSYKILFCTPRECRNRKFTFKVVHQGMRSYFFSADTQEDMLGWVRALSQCAAMELDSALNRRCSSYQDFTHLGDSSESVDFPKSPSDEAGLSQRRRNVSRTVSEPNQLSGGRMGIMQKERRSVRPSNITPSPSGSGAPVKNPPLDKDVLVPGSLVSRGQLGSRSHTPVGRVDIRPNDEPLMLGQTLYFAPASPQLEFKSTPTTPDTDRWQSLSKPVPTYGSVHHTPSGRRPLEKSFSTGTHTDLLPPLPPSSRVSHPPEQHHHHHHHHRSHLSVCVLPPALPPKTDSRESQLVWPLEGDADAVLTRLCGCDKLLQSLSVELAQLTMEKDSVQCALDVSRMQLEEWRSQGPRAHDEVLTQKALLQEELVTIRARMCDVSLEMEQVWSQYERMESELSVIRSHLQHICNFGIPPEQSLAQRELWMMEDILTGLKVNRDHICFQLGLQRHHIFQSPHPGSPGSPTERLQSGLTMDLDQAPPVRPPLPQELQEVHQSRDQDSVQTESPSDVYYSHTVDPVHTREKSQPDLLNVNPQRDASESQSVSKWTPQDTTTYSTKKIKIKMSEEEQIERMKRNQERMMKKKPPTSSQSAQAPSSSSEAGEEGAFPLRVTRVVTAMLPSSLVARRVSVEAPPAELDTPLPEQVPAEVQQKKAEQRSKMLNKPSRLLYLDRNDHSPSAVEKNEDYLNKMNKRQQGAFRNFKREHWLEGTPQTKDVPSSQQEEKESENLDNKAEEESLAHVARDTSADICLTPEQREAKLRRVERIRERVIQSAVNDNATKLGKIENRGRKMEVSKLLKNHRSPTGHETRDDCGSRRNNSKSSAQLKCSNRTDECEDGEHQHANKSKSQVKPESRWPHSGRPGFAKTKLRRPGSPYHISSMTVYQQEGGKGFVELAEDKRKKLEEQINGEDENDFNTFDQRAKWYLSTNQWQGFIPLQIPGIETLCEEDAADVENQAVCSDDITDSNGFSSAVSESLEKMKENHSLFYKIACDISISDSDLPKTDGNAQPSSRPEEEEDIMQQDSKDIQENASIKTSEHTPMEKSDDSIIPTNEYKDEQITQGSQSPNSLPDRIQDSNASRRDKPSLTQEVVNVPIDPESSQPLKRCTSLSKDNSEISQKQYNKHDDDVSDSAQEGRKVIRSASFGKARVTVLRTSL
ncbi:pleckstrin homology domain-containing family A member 4 isoform X2 [Gouania willdenowi]|uniref:pleckstrin homology domain-containing family A member 4 isoform X2 n=1 Tax=Gouania willdenowi TaxID=441366 RepID=UPI001055273F|nr:pleckstrin homology domain-containing family A member 6-like isoform X2 [Gouania willdenowi]